MKADTKKFLKVYFGIAVGVWFIVAVTLGPGDLSCSYRREYKEEHDQYLQIIKSEPYKRYLQRPELNQPGMAGIPDGFAEQIAFVEEYESRDEFRRERLRSSFYTVFFQFFNAGLVIWLAWHLGKAPVLKMLDDNIHDLRDKIAAVRNAREAAAERKNAVARKLEQVDAESEQILSQAEERLAREAAELEEKQERRLEIMRREMEDRQKEEMHAALMAVKAELVDNAVEELLQRYQQLSSEALHAKLIDAFTADLEKQVS